MERLSHATRPQPAHGIVPAAERPTTPAAGQWCARLPILKSGKITLRELELSDAHALRAFVSCTDVTKFLSPPPDSVEGFERFIAWARQQRSIGAQAACAVLVEGFETPVGLFQLRRLEPGFAT